MGRTNKLECLSTAKIFIIVGYLRVRTGAYLKSGALKCTLAVLSPVGRVCFVSFYLSSVLLTTKNNLSLCLTGFV